MAFVNMLCIIDLSNYFIVNLLIDGKFDINMHRLFFIVNFLEFAH